MIPAIDANKVCQANVFASDVITYNVAVSTNTGTATLTGVLVRDEWWNSTRLFPSLIWRQPTIYSNGYCRQPRGHSQYRT